MKADKAEKKKSKPARQEPAKAKDGSYFGDVKPKKKSPSRYYKLSEKDHPIIEEALYKFVPVYVLAKKIGCSYHTLLDYIKKHPELEQTRKDANDNMIEFAKGKLMQKVGAGHAASIMFLLERMDREHFGRYAQIENVGDLPAIQIGVFADDEIVQAADPSKMGDDTAAILQQAADMAQSIAEQDFAEEKTEG